MGQELGITVRFRRAGGGSGADPGADARADDPDAGGLTATIDIPQQGAEGLALTGVRWESPSVHFELPAGPGLAVFDGRLRGDTIAGDFTQSGVRGTFSVVRKAEDPAPGRSGEGEVGTGEGSDADARAGAGVDGDGGGEDAREPAPYREEEITFESGEVRLAGTLTLPEGDAPHPAVVLLTGSGPQNRDEELFGFRPFRILADHLGRRGIAVLRYDDRGVGGSTGSVTDATSRELAGDALAAVALLRERTEVRPDVVGLLGHSEGALVGPLAAARSGSVAFLVLLAPPAIPGDSLLLAQGALIARARGASEGAIEIQKGTQRALFRSLRTDEGWEEVERRMEEAIRAGIEELPEPRRAAIEDVEVYVETTVRGQLEAVRSPWFRAFLELDPAEALREVKVPVLALFGGKDLQVPPGLNREPLERALAEAPTEDVTVRVLPEGNHLFLAADTGSPAEYATLEKTFVPGLLETIAAWIEDRASAGS